MLVSALGLGLGLSAVAGSIAYSSYTGDNFEFNSVTESSLTDLPPLYGAPTVVGDTLLFSNPTFTSSMSEPGSDITDGKMDVTIEALTGRHISNLLFSESGSVTLSGTGTQATYAAVSANAFIRVEAIDGIDVTGIQINRNLAFTPSGSFWTLDNGAVADLAWQGSLNVDIDQALSDLGYNGHATRIHLTLDDVFNIGVEAPGITVSVSKHDISVTPVPEPAVLTILGLGLAGAIIRRRR